MSQKDAERQLRLNGLVAACAAPNGRLAPLQGYASARVRVRAATVALLFGLLAAPISADAPDNPAETAERARERAVLSINEALVKIRLLNEMTPKRKEKPACALLTRPEAWLHVPGKVPKRNMSIAAAVAAASDALGWQWSHALPSPVLYMDLDFGPARKSLSGAEWLCETDRLTGGLLRLQMYPQSRHLFVAQRIFSDEWDG